MSCGVLISRRQTGKADEGANNFTVSFDGRRRFTAKAAREHEVVHRFRCGPPRALAQAPANETPLESARMGSIDRSSRRVEAGVQRSLAH